MRKPFQSPVNMFSLMAALSLLLLSANLQAKQHMAITLKGTAEMPPVTTQSKGKGKIFVFPNRMVSGTIRTSGFVATRAYIQMAGAGENGPHIITLIKNEDGSFEVPEEARLTRAQYTSYMAGKLYVNVRSNSHPAGEIRAQLPLMRTAGRNFR